MQASMSSAPCSFNSTDSTWDGPARATEAPPASPRRLRCRSSSCSVHRTFQNRRCTPHVVPLRAFLLTRLGIPSRSTSLSSIVNLFRRPQAKGHPAATLSVLAALAPFKHLLSVVRGAVSEVRSAAGGVFHVAPREGMAVWLWIRSGQSRAQVLVSVDEQ